MIFKLEFSDRTEYVQARDRFDLAYGYIDQFGEEEYARVKRILDISDEQAKEIMLRNVDDSTFPECPEFSLYDAVVGDDFVIVGSTDW